MHEWKVECAVMKAEELWGSACKILQEEMTRISYSTWIETALKPCALVGDTVLLECVSPVVQQMGTSRYMGQIQKAVSTAAGRALTVEVYGHEELKDRLKALEARSSGDSLALLNEKAPNDQVIKLKALEAMQKVADGKATKIIIPSELQGFAGLASGIAETVKETK